MSTKFSQFASGGVAVPGSIIVGLKDGNNAQFTFPDFSEGVTWQTITVGQTMSPNNGYLINSVSRVSLLMPETFNVGDEIWIVSLYNSPWRITQNAGQKITYGVYASTVGVSGYVDSLGPDGSTNCGSVTFAGSTANTVMTVCVAISDTLNFE